MGEVMLVHSGREWEYEQAPCSRDMIRHLERNEGFVTWLQPKGGTVQDQFPVIRTRLGYCTMSLRMMKAVWCVACSDTLARVRRGLMERVWRGRRHVRLRKGFVNLENAPYGGLKLRIPSTLLVEKMRTQTRFNVSAVHACWRGSAIARPGAPRACIKRRGGGR